MAIPLEELQAKQGFTTAPKGVVTWLPEPERAERRYTVISVDDHVVEPPDAFAGRLPSAFADRAPRVVERDDGSEAWVFEGQELPNVGFNAVVGRPVTEYSFEPTRFDEMRRGAWDITARIADMDLNGVYASVCFPSFLPGFAGQRLQQLTDDAELALACVRAWNDWVIEAWAGAAPERMIPLQIPYLLDPDGRGRRGPAERGARVQGDDVLGSAAPARAAVAAHRLLGSADGGVRRDRDRRVPARRVVGHVTGHRARRAVRHHRRAVLRLRDVRRGRLALLAHPGALPRPQDLPLRGRHRLGRRAARPARPRAQVRRDVRHVERHRAESRPTRSGATSGSARSTTRRRSCSAT